MTVSAINTNGTHYEITDFLVCKFYPRKTAVDMNTNNSMLEMTNQEDKAEGNGRGVNTASSKICMGLLIAFNLEINFYYA